MTPAKVKFASFAKYLAWSDAPENDLEGRFELVDGELIAMPPESGLNDAIANRPFFLLVTSGIVPLALVRPGKCEIQVPVLQAKDPANRYPDLVILEEIHLALTQKRLTITLEMPPPRLVAEVLSPGQQNRDRETSLQENRDLIRKRAQYAARSIPEYWLLDPEVQQVMVLQLQDGIYAEVGAFQGKDGIVSPNLPTLQLTADQIFKAG